MLITAAVSFVATFAVIAVAGWLVGGRNRGPDPARPVLPNAEDCETACAQGRAAAVAEAEARLLADMARAHFTGLRDLLTSAVGFTIAAAFAEGAFISALAIGIGTTSAGIAGAAAVMMSVLIMLGIMTVAVMATLTFLLPAILSAWLAYRARMDEYERRRNARWLAESLIIAHCPEDEAARCRAEIAAIVGEPAPS